MPGGVACSQAPVVRMWASWGAATLPTVKWGQERQTGTCAVLEGRCENRLCGGAGVSFMSGWVPHFPQLSQAERRYLPLSRPLLPFTTDHTCWFWIRRRPLGTLTLFPTLQRSPPALARPPSPPAHCVNTTVLRGGGSGTDSLLRVFARRWDTVGQNSPVTPSGHRLPSLMFSGHWLDSLGL